MAIWSQRWFIVTPLVILIFGHWSLLLHGMKGVLLKATWLPGEGCTIVKTDNRLLAATYLYTMVFDFIVLLLTGYKLCNANVARSKLINLIFNDGLFYFVIA